MKNEATANKTENDSLFLTPSPFMERVKISDDIKKMSTLEIAQRLRYETENNGNCNWNDHEPEKCWYRQMAIELGSRICSQLNPEEWGDWQDEICFVLPGIAGYCDDWSFATGRMFGIEPEVWDELESFLKNQSPS